MFLQKILNNFTNYSNEIAFCINEKFYTYNDFEIKISTIINYLQNKNIKKNDIVIVYTTDDIETYASIFAIWFLGAIFVPLNPLHPSERNDLILKQIDAKLKIFKSDTANLSLKKTKIQLTESKNADFMYILFTSGSTGVPKGVPISLLNIKSFITDFSNSGYKLNHTDKFLQIYDLTFDASIHCYLLPIFLGGSVYTVPPKSIKYLQALKIIQKHKITFAKFPPSVLNYLKPYFPKIYLPDLKYSLLGGEAFYINIAKEWKKCTPNAQIQNVYGPTEATINTHIYNCDFNKLEEKTDNNIISIGKPFGSNKALIINENNDVLGNYQKGELCLSGNQITSGYIENPQKNKTSFVKIKINNKLTLFYKTGDLAYVDKDGDFIFCGRLDNQIQIQGYRVELHEIEAIANNFANNLFTLAIAVTNELGIPEIILYTEDFNKNTEDLLNYLKKKLPGYMIPKKIIDIKIFPQTTSGKIDKNKLKTMYNA